MTAEPRPSRPLRVVFCWAEVSGYIAACFQSLTRRPGLDVHVIHLERLLNRPNPFDVAPLMRNVSNEMIDGAAPDLDRFLLDAVTRHDPDIVVLCGWVFWPYTRLVHAPALRRARKLLGMDTPWLGTMIQRTAWMRLGHFVGGLDLVVTASEQSAEYARRIGVPGDRIRPGYYGFDFNSFANGGRPAAWPRQFAFAARYAPEKDLATLVAAYRRYRDSVSDPWGLTCHGQGPDRGLLAGVDGIVDAGFVQPADLPRVFNTHGAFVLPSRFEPWGVVIAEAAAAGLPVICSTACGAAADIVRPYYNGIVVPPGEPDALAHALRWIHDHEPELPEMGRRGQALADAYSADSWAARWHNYMLEAMDRPHR